ncbi:MAG: signal recognition particle subunit SRP54 [Mariniblastus sp.]|jgi:signal recognition particle subunit SRP54
MFDSLQDGLKGAFKSLRGKGKLTEGNMRDGLKLVETSLLEADVSIDVIRSFMGRLTEEALGEKVLLALNPSEQLVKIVHDELIGLLGPVDDDLRLDKEVNIIMMCGLQGAGKTTTCGKLAKLLQREAKITPLLCAADLQRPAAIDQLHVLGESLGAPVYSDKSETDPVKVCMAAVAQAKANGNRVVILDTAGRLAIDEELMEQLKTIDRKVQPDHVFLVVDGMTGQDAVKSAGAFHEALELNGVVMTKLDGDARGGALLSVKHVTGVPIRFLGTGEHLEDLEIFRPEGMASRILGMGDMVALAQQAQSLVDEDEQLRMQEALEKGQFSLDDFRNHMQKMAKPGLMQKMLGLLPGMPNMKEINSMMSQGETSKQIKQMVGIIDSMTQIERKNPKVIDVSRRQRIAAGSGVQPKQVSELIKQYDQMKPMLTGMAGMGTGDRMQQMRDLQSQMMDPSQSGPKTKKSTGKRLTPKEKKKQAKEREKRLRQMRRDKHKKPAPEDNDTQ